MGKFASALQLTVCFEYSCISIKSSVELKSLKQVILAYIPVNETSFAISNPQQENKIYGNQV